MNIVIVMMMVMATVMVITIPDNDCSESELQIIFINPTRRVPGLLLTLGGIYLGLGLFACLIITQVVSPCFPLGLRCCSSEFHQ